MKYINGRYNANIKGTGWTAFIILFLLCVVPAASQSLNTGWDQVPGIINNISEPTFPDRDFIITDFRALGDGTTDCTDAFREAIAQCHESGGGRVVVPQGVFLTGAIHLKSNVNLYVSRNATILFSKDKKKYLPIVPIPSKAWYSWCFGITRHLFFYLCCKNGTL